MPVLGHFTEHFFQRSFQLFKHLIDMALGKDERRAQHDRLPQRPTNQPVIGTGVRYSLTDRQLCGEGSFAVFVLHGLQSPHQALASCLTTTLVYHAAVQGIKIQELESEIEGDIDFRGMLGINDEVRKGYENIRVNFKIKSDTNDIEKLKELTTFSPILDVARNGTNVEVSIESK